MGDLLALAREVVTLPGWRWRPGMRAMRSDDPEWRWPVDHFRVVRCDADGAYLAADDEPDDEAWLTHYSWAELAAFLPDLADPATLGCLLALVREAWGEPHLVAIYCEAANPGQSEGWGVQTADNRLPIDGVGDHPTEGHALVAALRAAGGARG